MKSERTKQDKIRSAFNSKRAVDVGSISIDPRTGLGIKHSDIGNEKGFRLSPKQVTLLRILDSNQFIRAQRIAVELELAQHFNEAMLAASSNGSSQASGINGNSAEKILVTVDKLYGSQDPCALVINNPYILKAITDLRKKIGFEAIETERLGGYRLTRSGEVKEK